MNAISFDIITDKSFFIWVMRNKIKKYFQINYCKKEKGISTLIDNKDTYIINIFKKGFNIIISDNTEENVNKIVDKFINFFNDNFRNTTIGFKQDYGKKISLKKFKNLKVIELFPQKESYKKENSDGHKICPNCGAYIE